MARQKRKLALIDAHALIYRAYHALPPMSTREGVATNAVYGFTVMFLKMLTVLKPTHVVAAFDVKGPTFRHREYKEYKAHRPPAPDDLVSQFDVVREVLQAFNIPIVDKKGYEADDVIGTLTDQIDGGVKKVIVTGDLDALQLIDQNTSVFTLKRGVSDTVTYNEELVHERFGFKPELLVDYKGLRGDPSDNIPGVAGIGDKTAKDLVAKYGSIERIYDHWDELPGRAQKRLKGNKREALFSRKLATVKRDVPVTFNLAEAELADYDVDSVRALFERLEFRGLLQRLPKSTRGETQPTLLKSKTVRVRHAALPANYHLAERADEQDQLRKRLAQEKVIAFDTETDRLGAREYPIVGMSFALRLTPSTKAKSIEAWYVPVTPDSVKEWQGLLENKKVAKVGHNLKYDVEVLAQSGIKLKSIAFDSMIASYLLHPGARQHGLDTLAVQELQHYPIPITKLIGAGKEQKAMSAVPLPEIARYACEDAELTFRLYELFRPKIEGEGLRRVLEELELPLISVLADIELAGVRVDKAALKRLQGRVARRISALRGKIWRAAGEEFNINSTQQLRVILYEKLKLSTDGIKRTQSGYSTAASELEKLREQHKIIVLLEQYRELAKLQNTYITTLPGLIDEQTGRIYASFNQVVAVTGRLSSTGPNLQNIPVRTELGQEIRAAFVAPRGRRLVKADYSQLELRIAAHITQDEKMIESFRAGEDFHRATAAWVEGVSQKDVTDKQRRAAKALNFGVLYGMGPQKFSRAAGISVEEARSFIARYHEQYPGIGRLLEEIVARAEELGFVETLFGRRRYLPEINARAPAIRAQAERAAFNFPIQGTAADILKKAMVVLHEHLSKAYPQAQLVLTVHDELVCEVGTNQADALARDMRKIMANVYTLDVPILVDIAVGSNWRDMKAVK